MLHQPETRSYGAAAPPAPALNHLGQPIFDAAAYVDAMRAVGAELHPVRGKPDTIDLDGIYTIEAPAEPKARRRVAAIKKAFATALAADPAAAGRIAEHLLMDAATRRFAAIVGDDWSAARRELARQSDAYWRSPDREDDDPEAAHAGAVASEAYHAACEHALTMPLRRAEDLACKAEFALRHCHWDGHVQQVLAEIAAFGQPEPADALAA